jgi:hypothetical protein
LSTGFVIQVRAQFLRLADVELAAKRTERYRGEVSLRYRYR